MKKFLKFVYIFFIIGLESLGNMSAVMIILEENLVKKNQLVTKEDVIDAVTMARIGPGATTANAVAFLGNKIAGFWGGVLATICYTIGPLIVISLIINYIEKMLEYPLVVSALKGSLICISVVLVNSTISMGKSVLINKFNICIFVISLLISIIFNVSSVWIIILAILVRHNKKSCRKTTQRIVFLQDYLNPIYIHF